MSEAGQAGTQRGGQRRTSPPIDHFCDALRDSLHSIVDAFTPPESARNHFQESRIEFWRGIRDIIDHRIERMSRSKTNTGRRIVVE